MSTGADSGARAKLQERLHRVTAALPGGGEVRDAQIEMTVAVADALIAGTSLVVRAGTGVGKSLAYLLPAAAAKGPVLVATATLALQDQLARKDLPFLSSQIDERLDFAVLKGRANYLCRQRLVESHAAGEQGELGEAHGTGARAEQIRAILEWSTTTRSGDRAELDFSPDARVWSAFSVTAQECPGAHRCPSGEDCFAEAAREQARTAQICVANLHLLGAHLAAGGGVLPEFDALIVDEAHELESVLSVSLGRQIAPGRLRALVAEARALRLGDTAEAALAGVSELAGNLETVLADLGERRLRSGLPPELEAVRALGVARLARLESVVVSDAEDSSPSRLRLQGAAGALRGELEALSSIGDGEVAWVTGGVRPSLEVAPLDLAPAFSAALGEIPVILTSATVPLTLGERLGLDMERTRVLALDSPFDYEHHALLYCAAHLPERRSVAFEPAMCDELVALIEAAGGRTLALFTSRAVMDRCADAVSDRVKVPVVVQDRLSRQAALAAFSSDEATCLFATIGFWQGIDVPGPALSLVVIDRLPFPRPDEPLAQARREAAGAAGFRQVDLVHAQSLLAQGAGRLIRSATDRGVVAVLDPRLATASYRWELVRALPPMRRTRERNEALKFLRALASDRPPQ